MRSRAQFVRQASILACRKVIEERGGKMRSWQDQSEAVDNIDSIWMRREPLWLLAAIWASRSIWKKCRSCEGNYS